MIKFLATTRNGGVLIGLGITAGNVDRLKDGKPIHVNVAELIQGVPEHAGKPLFGAEIAIFYGEDEDAITAEFREHGVKVDEFRDERERAR